MTPEARTEYIVGCIREAGSMYPEDATAFLAEHDANRRAEVRREVLGDDLNPSSLVLDAQAYRWLADDIIATMDDPNRWGADETEQVILSRYVKWLADGKPPRDDEWDGDEPPADGPTQPADFFQPGRTYQRQHHGHTVTFRVEHVATPPGGTDPIAFGWRTEPCLGGWAPEDSDDIEGWTHVTDAPGDRFPYLGTAPRAAVAYRSPTSGRLYCRQCCTRLGAWAYLASEDLPDGGICACCGTDVLIDPQQSEAGEAQ